MSSSIEKPALPVKPLVVIPFVRGLLRRETIDAAPNAHFVDVGGADDSYWRLLCRLWEQGNAFALIEQDISPTRAQIDTLWACSAEWCAFPYNQGGIVTTALGCTKFSS